MPIVVVANPKGGVGKTTVASHIAGYFANQGHRTMLGDIDKQQSSRLWLSQRPEAAVKIDTWDIHADRIARPPKGTSHVVLDSPAGLHGWRFKESLGLANALVIPIQPSIFDMFATKDFIDDVQDFVKTTKWPHKLHIGLIGTRMDERTLAAEKLLQFVQTLAVPWLGSLRNTQNYLHLAAHGLTVFDVAPSRVEKDLAQWEPICTWLNKIH
jgi:chromosome partitioning protein